MPRLKMTEAQQREKALERALSRARVDLDLDQDQEVASFLNLHPSTFARRKKELYRSFGFEEAASFARRLNFTAQEICDIFGVPYEPENKLSRAG